jgi:hypothetical protein
MANAAEFLARWKVRYIDAEGRILEELDTIVAECVEDASEEGFSREDLDQAAGGELKAYIRETIAKAQGIATASIERKVAGGRRIEVTRMRITGAGRRALTKLRWP